MIAARSLACTSALLLALASCGESGESAETAQAPSGGEARSPFDVTPPSTPPGPPPSTATNAAPDASPTAPSQTATSEDGTPTAPAQTGDTFRAGGITFTIPDGWESRTPRSSMRAAELAIPSGDGGDEDAVLAVFAGIRGTVEQNITRWIGQVSNPTATPYRETRTVGSLTIYTVMITGTFSTGPMMGGGAPSAGTTVLGAVVTGGPGGDVHLKLTGPASVISSNLDGWEALLKSAKAG